MCGSPTFLFVPPVPLISPSLHLPIPSNSHLLTSPYPSLTTDGGEANGICHPKICGHHMLCSLFGWNMVQSTDKETNFFEKGWFCIIPCPTHTLCSSFTFHPHSIHPLILSFFLSSCTTTPPSLPPPLHLHFIPTPPSLHPPLHLHFIPTPLHFIPTPPSLFFLPLPICTTGFSGVCGLW